MKGRTLPQGSSAYRGPVHAHTSVTLSIADPFLLRRPPSAPTLIEFHDPQSDWRSRPNNGSGSACHVAHSRFTVHVRRVGLHCAREGAALASRVRGVMGRGACGAVGDVCMAAVGMRAGDTPSRGKRPGARARQGDDEIRETTELDAKPASNGVSTAVRGQ